MSDAAPATGIEYAAELHAKKPCKGQVPTPRVIPSDEREARARVNGINNMTRRQRLDSDVTSARLLARRTSASEWMPVELIPDQVEAGDSRLEWLVIGDGLSQPDVFRGVGGYPGAVSRCIELRARGMDAQIVEQMTTRSMPFVPSDI